MGSPTSFPVLCLVNVAATLVSFNRAYGKKVALSDLPVCINGDDVLFWSRNQKHYEIWKQITGECGLKFSLGKNYTSRDFCVINSELYLHTKGIVQPGLLFRKEKALNSRLLSGGTRSSGQSGFDPLMLSDKDVEIISQDLEIPAWRFVGVKPNNRPLKSLIRDIRMDYLESDFPEDFAKWYNTITARSSGFVDQMIGDQAGASSRDSMMKSSLQIFNDLQVSRLHKFARIHPGVLEYVKSFYVPQTLGGLGLIPPGDHSFSKLEYLLATTLAARPELAHPWVKSFKPKMASVSFMESIRAEIRDIQDTLEIKEELVTAEDLEMLRFHGETEQFWEHSFLTGFVDMSNTVIDPAIRAERLSDFNIRIKRSKQFGRKLGSALHHQADYLVTKGVFSLEDRVLGTDGKCVWIGTAKGAMPFKEREHFHTLHRPMPRFV